MGTLSLPFSPSPSQTEDLFISPFFLVFFSFVLAQLQQPARTPDGHISVFSGEKSFFPGLFSSFLFAKKKKMFEKGGRHLPLLRGRCFPFRGGAFGTGDRGCTEALVLSPLFLHPHSLPSTLPLIPEWCKRLKSGLKEQRGWVRGW